MDVNVYSLMVVVSFLHPRLLYLVIILTYENHYMNPVENKLEQQMQENHLWWYEPIIIRWLGRVVG